LLAVEPEVVVNKAVEPGFCGKFRLLFANLGQTQIIEAHVSGYVGLIMTAK